MWVKTDITNAQSKELFSYGNTKSFASIFPLQFGAFAVNIGPNEPDVRVSVRYIFLAPIYPRRDYIEPFIFSGCEISEKGRSHPARSAPNIQYAGIRAKLAEFL